MTALAFQTETYDRKNTVLGIYGNGVASIESGTPIHGGNQSLKFVETPLGGTPQASATDSLSSLRDNIGETISLPVISVEGGEVCASVFLS